MTGKSKLVWAAALAVLGIAGSSFAAAQAGAPPCKVRQLEVYQEGGDAGLGHGRQIVGLRNVSSQTCTLLGPPRLEFFDQAGKRLAIPYGKNEPDMMFEPQPEKPVTLASGDFAYFMIGTTHGDEHLHFNAMRVLLPGDATPMMVDGAGAEALQSIDVSAIIAGVNAEDGFAVPGMRIAVTHGSLDGVSLTLDVPTQPKGPFDAHLALLNTGNAPVRIDWKHCSLEEELTNSAGRVVHSAQPCGALSGEMASGDRAGMVVLRQGARATADIPVGEVALQLCREGRWSDALTLETPAGAVRFSGIPFDVVSTACSDSEHVGEYVDENSVRWTLVPQHGVRLGVAVVAGGDGAQSIVPFPGKTGQFRVSEFRVGEPIQLRLYLDDLSDEPLALRVGPGAFRVVARVSGSGATMVPSNPPDEPVASTPMTVQPHSWRFVQEIALQDWYSLVPGSYDLTIGPRTLTGEAAGANAPATGWPYTEGSATVQTFVRIVP